MKNKLLLSLCDKGDNDISIERIFNIIKLYGNGYVNGIEICSLDVEKVKKCASLCKENNIIFRCHFPSSNMQEDNLLRYIDLLGEIANHLKHNVNVVFHSLSREDDTIEDKVSNTKEYMQIVLEYIKKCNFNITASLENLNFRHNMRRINVGEIDKILAKYNNLAFTYDIGHDIYDNKKASNLSDLQIKRMNNIHIHSIVKMEDHHEIRNDSSDIDVIINALENVRNINYSGPIVLEYAVDFFEGKDKEEKIINYVKSFKVLKDILESLK